MMITVIVALLGLFLKSTDARAPLTTPLQLPLKTSSRWIVDSHGKRVKWSCVNWSGAAQKDGVVGGLQHQHRSEIAKVFADMGFNCVRIPWSVQTVLQPHVVSNETLLGANRDLIGKSTDEILDAIVSACAKEHIMIIMDNHMSDADWCCSLNDENGLWYNDRWSESDWIHAHLKIATRYENEPYVVAAELRNELRAAVINGTNLEPKWGGNDIRTDWKAAALRASSAILKARPEGLLIVLDNIAYSTDFRDLYKNPIVLPVSNRLVYSAHDYGWSQPQNQSTKEELFEYLGARWGYLVKQNEVYTAPVWVSEFGTSHTGSGMDPNGWWTWLMEYLMSADFDFGYWRGDGTESQGTGRTFGAPALFGILNATWNGPASNATLLNALKPLQNPTQGPGL